MEALYGLAFALLPALFLIVLGIFVGRSIERKHFADLKRREVAVSHVLATQMKTFHQPKSQASPPIMLVSEVVISSDYLKSFVGAIQNFVGGEIHGFQTLLERARREALLRMKEQALERGYDAICCVRLNTAEIGGHDPAQKRAIVMVSLLASGTAYRRGSVEPMPAEAVSESASGQ